MAKELLQGQSDQKAIKRRDVLKEELALSVLAAVGMVGSKRAAVDVVGLLRYPLENFEILKPVFA